MRWPGRSGTGSCFHSFWKVLGSCAYSDQGPPVYAEHLKIRLPKMESCWLFYILLVSRYSCSITSFCNRTLGGDLGAPWDQITHKQCWQTEQTTWILEPWIQNIHIEYVLCLDWGLLLCRDWRKLQANSRPAGITLSSMPVKKVKRKDLGAL